MPSLLEILNDPNYVNANQATKEAIFNKYSAQDANYAEANDATKEAIKKRFGIGAAPQAVEKPADTRKAEEVGALERIGTSFKRGFEGLGDIASGLGLAGTAALGSKEDTAKKMAEIKKEQEAQARGTPTLSAADIQRIAEERGLVSAGAQVPSYIAEQILQSAPQMAIPLAVGAGAAAVSGPFAPVVGPVAGIAAYGIQQFGNFLVRQAQEKKDPEELELAKAAVTAAGTAPIGYFVDKWTTGLGSVGSKEASKQIFRELSARQAAGEIGKRAAKGATIGIIAEAPTEVLEQAAERYQAGLSLTGDDATKEYKEAFFGAAAAGAGIGGGAKAIGAYGDYRGAKQAEKTLDSFGSEKNAFTESEEVGTGDDTGVTQQGIPGSEEQVGDTGRTEAPVGDELGGSQLPPKLTRDGEEVLDNQLRTVDVAGKIAANTNENGEIDSEPVVAEIIKEVDTALRTGQPVTLYTDGKPVEIVGIANGMMQDAEGNRYGTFPLLTDPQGKLGNSLQIGSRQTKTFGAPGIQQGLDLQAADETTQRAIEVPETATPEEFTLEAEAGALPTGDVTKIEEVSEAPKAKMMLVGEGANPTAPAEAFLNSIKPATANPAQAVQFKNEVRNLIEDMLDFIGQSRQQVSRFREENAPAPVPATGPDVSVPLTGPQRQMRLNVLDKFFDSLSAAPAGQENQTATLAQRLPGMSAEAQSQAFQNLLNIPNINTVRGIKEVRAKLQEELAKFEGEQIQEPVEKAATVYKNDETQTEFVRRAIQLLKNIPESMRTPQEKAAAAYFGRFNFGLAMRSAAFDLGVVPDKFFEGPVFKGQNKAQAELFQEWVKENLPAEEYRRFEATVKDFKKQTEKADAYQKKAEEVSKLGSAASLVAKVAGRAPTGKAKIGIAEAGLSKYMKPSEIKRLEVARFYPMHPAVEQALEQGNLDRALSIIERFTGPKKDSYVRFQAALAGKLRSLGLQTSVVFGQQQQIADSIFKRRHGESYAQLVAFLEATNNPAAKFFKDPSDFRAMREGLKQVKDPELNGQVEDLTAGVDAAIATLESSGTYVYGMDSINLNKEMGGASNYTLLHELVHAATVYSLAPENYATLSPEQQKAVDELKVLYETSKKTGLRDYGFSSLEEFVAEAFTNEKFQDLLKTIPYKGAQEQFATTDEKVGPQMYKNQRQLDLRRTLWDKFTQLVAKIFGMNNMLGYTLANANVILQAPPALTKDVAAFNANPNKTASRGNFAIGPKPMRRMQGLFDSRPTWQMVKEGMPSFLRNLDSRVRKYYLGAFTLRQLADLVGNRVNQFKSFVNKAEELYDERNRIINEVADIEKEWQTFKSENPEQSDTLDIVMIDATVQGKDPAKGATGIPELDDNWNKLDAKAKKIYTRVANFFRTRMEEYKAIIRANKIDSLKARGLTDAEIATHDTLKKVAVPGLDTLRNQLKAQGLSDAGIAEQVKTFKEDFFKKKGYTPEEILAHQELSALEAFFKKHTLEPYFPLRRFGRFSLQIGDGVNKEYYLFESPREREIFRKERLQELKDDGVFVEALTVRERDSFNEIMTDMQDISFMNELKEVINNANAPDVAGLKETLNDAVEQFYLLTLPDQSIRKAFLTKRKNTAGMSSDMLRGFTKTGIHMAYQQSKYKYSKDLYGYVKTAKEDVARRTDDDSAADAEYVNELNERLKFIMNPPEPNPIVNWLSNASFVMYMTAPASALVNMLGVPAVGMPVIAAKYGWGKTAAKIGEYAKKYSGTGFRDAEGKLSLPSVERSDLTDVQKAAFERFVRDGVIDITLTHDLINKANTPTELHTGRGQKVMNALAFAFHGAEKFNREVVAMASFDLAYEKAKKGGLSDEAAFKKAINEAKELTYKSMFDYSTINKPRYFQNDYAKVVLQFKQFSQQMTYLLARSVYEAVHKNYTQEELNEIRQQIKRDHAEGRPDAPELTGPELDKAVEQYLKDVRTEARNRLAGILGTTAVFAGVSGLPLFSVVAATMNALQAVFGDDEEEWDFKNWFKNWTHNTFGGFLGDSISRGVASQVLGADLSSRLSLSDLWFRDTRQSSDEVSNVQAQIINLLGPSANLAVTAFGQIPKLINDGHIDRAIEAGVPAIGRSFLKTARYIDEGGVKNLKGDEIIGDLSGLELAVQALGFNPERVAKAQQANIEAKTIEQKLQTRRNDLMTAYFMGIDNDDDALIDRTLDKIAAFNEANPEFAISGSKLSDSVRTRYRNRALAETTNGMGFNKKFMLRAEELQGYGRPD